MTEFSRYWNGLVTGDATLAPYSAGVYQDIWDKLFLRADNEGYLESYLDELEITGIRGGVEVKTGGAVVDGVFYENDSVLSISIPAPTTDPRIDRIVVRKNSTSQEARLFRIVGTEAASPSAPSLLQSDTIWDIPLAQALVTIAGTITITDEREKARTPLAPGGIDSIEKIETIVADGIITEFDFQDIPQRFKHLSLNGFGKHSDPGPDDHIEIYARFNGDAGNNYDLQFLEGFDTAVIAFGDISSSLGAKVGSFLSEGTSPPIAGQFSATIPSYSLTTFYKTLFARFTALPGAEADNTSRFLNEINSVIWEDTSAITRIQIVADPTFFDGANALPFTAGSEITLYGLD